MKKYNSKSGLIKYLQTYLQLLTPKKALKIYIILFTCILLSACNVPEKSTVFSGLYFDTYITVTIYDNTQNSNIINILNKQCEKYDSIFSTDNPESEIYKINNANGKATICSNELIDVLKDAIYYSELSNGLLDPTIETVSELWNFNSLSENNILPSQKLLNDKLQFVNYKNIKIENNYVTIPTNSKIGLGYIAKGYIADSLQNTLKSNGFNNYIINLGGNILLSGNKPDGNIYTIGIEKPFSTNDVADQLTTTNTSIVTSGIYERYFKYQGNIYHHILDVNTGYPINNNLYSVTVTGPSSEKCDALSTFLFILGKDKGLEYINSLDEYEALFILNDYSIVKSNNF